MKIQEIPLRGVYLPAGMIINALLPQPYFKWNEEANRYYGRFMPLRQRIDPGFNGQVHSLPQYSPTDSTFLVLKPDAEWIAPVFVFRRLNPAAGDPLISTYRVEVVDMNEPAVLAASTRFSGVLEVHSSVGASVEQLRSDFYATESLTSADMATWFIDTQAAWMCNFPFSPSPTTWSPISNEASNWTLQAYASTGIRQLNCLPGSHSVQLATAHCYPLWAYTPECQNDDTMISPLNALIKPDYGWGAGDKKQIFAVYDPLTSFMGGDGTGGADPQLGRMFLTKTGPGTQYMKDELTVTRKLNIMGELEEEGSQLMLAPAGLVMWGDSSGTDVCMLRSARPTLEEILCPLTDQV